MSLPVGFRVHLTSHLIHGPCPPCFCRTRPEKQQNGLSFFQEPSWVPTNSTSSPSTPLKMPSLSRTSSLSSIQTAVLNASVSSVEEPQQQQSLNHYHPSPTQTQTSKTFHRCQANSSSSSSNTHLWARQPRLPKLASPLHTVCPWQKRTLRLTAPSSRPWQDRHLQPPMRTTSGRSRPPLAKEACTSRRSTSAQLGSTTSWRLSFGRVKSKSTKLSSTSASSAVIDKLLLRALDCGLWRLWSDTSIQAKLLCPWVVVNPVATWSSLLYLEVRLVDFGSISAWPPISLLFFLLRRPCTTFTVDGQPDPATVKGFLAGPHQGICYKPGIWHHPLIALAEGQTDAMEFQCMVYETGVAEVDCDLVEFASPIASVSL